MTSSIPVKSYISSKIKVKLSRIHGSGIFAVNPISKGEIVFVKGGHIVTREELFYSQLSYHPIDDDLFLGALSKEEENDIKIFVNHSCNPNCGIRGEISFVALRDIDVDEELTFDYAMLDNEGYQFECTCKSENCRKKVTGFDWKLKDLQKKYGQYFARYLLDKINV